MKHENEPEEAPPGTMVLISDGGLPVCNFCWKEYDPYDVHTCPGNQIIPRKLRRVVEEEAPTVVDEEGIVHPAYPELKGIASALSTQLGGDHYRKHAIQPVEYIVANGISFLAGNIVKYATRYKDKGGADDIRKIKHYCDLILEFEYKETSK